MTTHFIGQILEVKPYTRTDKKTKKEEEQTQVTVMFDGYDEGGYRVPSIETITVAEHWFDDLRINKGKFVAIAYRTINTQNGTYTFPDQDIAPLFLEKNPLNYDEYKRPDDKARKV